ncbi:MAG: copper resistance protein CopC [Humibacillus sp.]|nr:copper resistance protein CopC [Humibacillus sp.]
MRRAVSVLLLLLVATLWAPLGASAHDVLSRTDPAAGATVSVAPDRVSLTFTEAPLSIGTQVVVTGPGGPVQVGSPTVSGTVVSQSLSPSAPGGDYTVAYRVTSDDGHPVTGTFSFRATTGSDGSAATGVSTIVSSGDTGASAVARGGDDSSFPLAAVLLTVVGTVVLLAIGGFVALRGRQSDRPDLR